MRPQLVPPDVVGLDLNIQLRQELCFKGRYLELKLNRTGQKVQQRTSFSTDDSATAVPTTEMVSSPPELLRFISARMCQSLLIADISVKQFIELDQ